MLSVIMPAHNSEKYIGKSIDSILNQSFKQFELLIYNDCSTDKTLNIIREYQKKDSRIKIFSGKKNIKQPLALNFLLKKTKYPSVALNDSDDISNPDRFLKQIVFLEKNQEYGAVGSYALIINENSKFIRKIKYPTDNIEIKKKLPHINCFAQSSMMIRKKIVFKVGLFNKLLDPAQDYDMWCRFSHITKLSNIPEYLIKYREHSLSSSNLKRKLSFYKSEFIKINYKYLKKKKDLINSKNISQINKSTVLQLLHNNKKKINKIKLESSFSDMAYFLKEHKIVKFLFCFIDIFFKDPVFMIKKINFFINKTYK